MDEITKRQLKDLNEYRDWGDGFNFAFDVDAQRAKFEAMSKAREKSNPNRSNKFVDEILSCGLALVLIFFVLLISPLLLFPLKKK